MKESFFQFRDPQLINLEFVINEEFDEELFAGFFIESELQNGIIENKKEAAGYYSWLMRREVFFVSGAKRKSQKTRVWERQNATMEHFVCIMLL